MNDLFRKIANSISLLAGSPWAFIVAVIFILTWVVTGPLFGFSDSWQLVVNTGTNIITLLMVFLIQNTQNRDTKAVHLKLDELLKGDKGARNSLIDVEDVSDEELETLQDEFKNLHESYTKELERRKKK